MMVFFFQAEDGIRDGRVTGVQTCALPISFGRAHIRSRSRAGSLLGGADRTRDAVSLHRVAARVHGRLAVMSCVEAQRSMAKIGRASCRERVQVAVAAGRSKGRGAPSSSGG